jgi:hypothetical protein
LLVSLDVRRFSDQKNCPDEQLGTTALHSMNLNEATLTREERLVTWLLRLLGGMVVLAFVPVFFPPAWMEHFHQLMGLGSVPDQPVFWYLARSLSLMYFAHGLMVLAISTDVRRYWPLVQLLGWLNIALGVILLFIDLNAPMPWYWTLAEGPGIIVGGIVLLALVRLNRPSP